MKWLNRVKENWGRQGREEACAAIHPPQADSMPVSTQLRPPLTDAERFQTLSPRERQVFNGLLAGNKQREIAVLLRVRPATISFHCTALYRKLDIHDKAHLFLRYARFLAGNEK